MSLASLFEARDLDQLRELADDMSAAGLDQDDEASITGVLTAWTDVQAVANVLMYPTLIPQASRRDWLLRGLSADEPYLRLAAAVGVGQLPASTWSEPDVEALVPALLILVERDGDVTASRAALSLVPLARPADAPDLMVLLDHPDAGVRRNLESALLRSAGREGIATILDAGFLDEDDTHAAREVLAADGVALDDSAEEQVLFPVAAYIPNYADFAD